MSSDYLSKITILNDEISRVGDDWHLYYERGYYHFLMSNLENSKQDYYSAIKFGLDVTEYPYYSFTDSNKMRRDFLLPEKILVFLIFIMVLVSIYLQFVDFIH